MTTYDLTLKCIACSNGIHEGCPVLVDTEMCPTCTFGEWEANQEALDNIANGNCKVIDHSTKKRRKRRTS